MKERSARFVQALAVELRVVGTQELPNEEVVGLARGLNDLAQRKGFLLTELLWDATVVHAPIHDGRRRVQSCIWAVESEMAVNFTEVQKDFNKLVLASAANRLLVAADSVLTKHLSTLEQWCIQSGTSCWLAGLGPIGQWPEKGLLSLRLVPESRKVGK